MAADKSRSAGHRGRFSRSSARAARRPYVAALAMVVLGLIGMGVPAVAEDDRVAPAPDATPDARTDPPAPRDTTASRVYVPLHPGDPAQVDKQFAIGQDTAFGIQSEELIRSGHRDHDRDAPRASPPGLPEAAAK
jgi:hypothetical protein